MNFDCLVIGCGFSGATAARVLAENGRHVLVLERCGHIGGNAYDQTNASGILIHPYGPHIFHTNHDDVHAFLSRFCAWRPYFHRVEAHIRGALLPVPFNLRSLYAAFDAQTAARLSQKLIRHFGFGSAVSLADLRPQADADLRMLADYIHENMYQGYSRKQWGEDFLSLDSTVLGRVPIRISQDCRYFQDRYQGLPAKGYAALFRNMLAHPRISLLTGTAASHKLSLRDQRLLLEGRPLDPRVQVVYTGSLDELFAYCLGRLPYRAVRLAFETLPMPFYQRTGTVNYTVSEPFTRITEYKRLTGQLAPHTAIAREYAIPYKPGCGAMPGYPILTEANKGLHARYHALARAIPQLHCTGRLAEYRYYNMDDAVRNALRTAKDCILGVRT